MTSVVVLVRTKSESYFKLLFPGSPWYSGACRTGGCSAAISVVPSSLISNVHLPATSQISAPFRSRTHPRSAAKGVLLSTCHIDEDFHRRKGLVDVDRRALDLVVTTGPAQNVRALDQYLASPSERNA